MNKNTAAAFMKPLAASKSFSLSALDHSSALPLHAQVEAQLRRLIELPEYQKGALLPDELSLADRFGVSRGTVRLALVRLVNLKILERKAGVGTRVLPAAADSSIGEWHSFSREMARRNIQVESFLLEVRSVSAPAAVAGALKIPEGTKVLRLDRVRGWEKRPVLHSRSWLHPRLKLTETSDFKQPLYELIQQKTGTIADSAREEFSAVQAPAVLARHLGVKPGTPLLLRRHTVFDPGKRPMEYAEVHYVSEHFTLTLELKRDAN